MKRYHQEINHISRQRKILEDFNWQYKYLPFSDHAQERNRKKLKKNYRKLKPLAHPQRCGCHLYYEQPVRDKISDLNFKEQNDMDL